VVVSRASGPFIIYIVVITDMMEPMDRFDKESIERLRGYGLSRLETAILYNLILNKDRKLTVEEIQQIIKDVYTVEIRNAVRRMENLKLVRSTFDFPEKFYYIGKDLKFAE